MDPAFADFNKSPNNAETLTICVGPEEQEFKVPIEMITRASKLIESAVRGMADETGRKYIVLSKLSADTFERYLGYLTHGSGHMNLSGYFEGFLAFGRHITVDERHRSLAECYVLAAYLEDSTCCGDAIYRMASALLDHECSPEVTNSIWDRTTPASSLRKLVLEFWAVKPMDVAMRRFKSPENNFSKAFCIDYFEHLMKSHSLTKSNLPKYGRSKMMEHLLETALEDEVDKSH